MSTRFIKTIIASLLLSHVVYVPLAWSADVESVVIHNKALDLTKEKVINEFLMQTPELQSKLKNNEMAFRKFVDAINNELLFEAEANKQNLKADPMVAKKIDIAIRKALITELIAQKTANIKVPDMAPLALAEYKAYPEKYISGEAVNARHILVTFDEKNKAEKRAFLETISKRVAAGESFAELAKQYSEDKGSAAKGGELGVFERGKTVKPFEDAAFSLKKPQQLSGVIETQFGWHLIQLIEYFSPKRQNFEVVKAGLITSMEQDYIKNEINTWRDAIIDLKNANLNQAELEKLISDVKKLP
ncbi:MAG: peptidylprolyl isomerase [Methylococcaceae bacterium]